MYGSAPQVLQWAHGVSANGTFELTGLPSTFALVFVDAKWLSPNHPDNVAARVAVLNAAAIAPGQVREVEIEIE